MSLVTQKQKLSVIVPVYNCEPHIERCIDSILDQEFEGFEILLVVEMLSTDRTVEICRRISEANKRIKFFSENNSGISTARNRGLKEAQGEYITFVDADDYILPGMLSTMLGRAVTQDLDITCCSSKKDTGNQHVADMSDYMKYNVETYIITPQNQRDYMYKLAINGRSGTVWAKLFRRRFLIDNKLEFHLKAYSEDFVFSYNCFAAAKSVGTIGESLYIYFDRKGSRIYSSGIDDVKQSAAILWESFLGYSGIDIEDVRSYASVRIISSSLFNLNLKQLPVEKVCEIVWDIIDELGIEAYLQRASDSKRFNEYANAVELRGDTAENFLLFIRSLGNYDTMLGWQKKYLKMEEKQSL